MAVFRGGKCPEEQITMAKSSFNVKKIREASSKSIHQVQETGSKSSGGG
jgi:hypothetical protein